MKDWRSFFKGKRVTVMGLGLLGRGLGDALFLAEQGAELIITDLRDEKTLAPSLTKLKKHKNIQYVLGKHRSEDFKDRDFILKAAGVPLNSLYITEAQKHDIPVYMSTALFAKFARDEGASIVGVTGTRGKSTVTHLIHHVLRSVGARTHLGGNVRGISTLALLSLVQKGDICVLELDSWQLQGFGTLKISPDISVFTNLKSDHLNYYPDEQAYFEDKANVYQFQRKDDVLVTTRAIINGWLGRAKPPGKVVLPSPVHGKLKIIGNHNKENAELAAKTLRILRVPEDDIQRGLESFEPIEGRLQLMRSLDGIDIYNDNNATTPDATIAAIATLLNLNKKIVLILGGSDKSINPEMLARMLNTNGVAHRVVLLPGTGTEKLKNFLDERTWVEAHSMAEAVTMAVDCAHQTKSTAILFSPAFASFGLFKNEYDRGNQFVTLINQL